MIWSLISFIWRLVILPFSILFFIISNRPRIMSSRPSNFFSSRDTFSSCVPDKIKTYQSNHILTIVAKYLLFIYFYINGLIPIAQIEGCLSFTEGKSAECRQEGRKVFVLQVPHTSTVLGSVDLGLTLHGSNACPKQLKHGCPWYAVQSWNFLSSDRNWIRSFRVVNLIYICYSLILWFGGLT